MKQSGHLNPSEETGTGFLLTSKYGGIPPNKHGGVGRQQQWVDNTSEELRKLVGVEPITTVMRWYEHVMTENGEDCVIKCLKISV